MSKIHYFQRYSSVENTVTNNTLQLIARVYAYSTTQASQLLSDLTGEAIEIGIEVHQQARACKSVPDGKIVQRSFRILIEAKVDSAVNIDQLRRHSESFSREEKKVLLLLTREAIAAENEIKSQLSTKHPDLIFKNVTYESICRVVKSLFQEYEYEMRALIDDYIEYCNDAHLFDQSRYLMRIVPCGQSLAINRKHGIYFHPSDRGYTEHQFLGIYKEKAVQAIWEIDSVFDVEYDGVRLHKKLIRGSDTRDYDDKLIAMIADAKADCGYDIATGHRFFCGTPADTDYRKTSPGGIWGQRFVNLKEIIGEFSDASDAAHKLRGKEWE